MQDSIDALLVPLLEAPTDEQVGLLDELCAEHPNSAQELRSRFALFRQFSDLAPSSDSEAALPRRFGDFELIRVLGEGAMGVVYLARQIRGSTERTVALKLVRDRAMLSSTARERLLREGRATFGLDHPALCPVLDVGEVDATPFVAMRYVPGKTLAAHIAGALERQALLTLPAQELGHGTDGPASTTTSSASESSHAFAATLALVEGLARGLHAAHERGLVHRDVKPSNIIVSESTGMGVLLDFGLVHDSGGETSRLTVTGQALGTPAYMAPEQIEAAAGSAGPAADIYSLGATLFEALTLELPFAAPTREALFREILGAPLPDASKAHRHISRDMQTVLATALAREPRGRYTTALEFADDLRRLRFHQPIEAQRPRALKRLSLWSRRNPFAAAVLVLLAISQCAILGLAVTAYREASAARSAESRALTHFQAARDAVAELTRTASQHLTDVPWLDPVRRKLIDKALAFYRQFLESEGGSSQLQFETAIALSRGAKLLLQRGEVEEAEDWASQGISLLQALSAVHVEAVRRDLPSAYAIAARIAQRRGQSDVAIQRYRAAIAAWSRGALSTESRRGVGNARRRFAAVLRSTGHADEAREELQQSIDLFDQDTFDDRTEQAATRIELAMLQKDFREFEASDRTFASANEQLRDLLREHPTSRRLRSLIANGLLTQSQVVRRRSIDDSRVLLKEAATHTQHLVQAFPNTPSYVYYDASASIALASLASRQRDLVAAREHAARGIEILEPFVRDNPDLAQLRRSLATAYFNRGNYGRGTPEARGYYSRTVETLQPLIDAGTGDLRTFGLVGKASRNLAIELIKNGDSDAAVLALLRARKAVERQAELRPDHPKTRMELILQHTNEAALFADLGRLPEARESLTKAVAQRLERLRRSPSDRQYENLLSAYAFHGRVCALIDPRACIGEWRTAERFAAERVPDRVFESADARLNRAAIEAGLGIACGRSGDHGAALHSLERAHATIEAHYRELVAGSSSFGAARGTVTDWIEVNIAMATVRSIDDRNRAAGHLDAATGASRSVAVETLSGYLTQRLFAALTECRVLRADLGLAVDEGLAKLVASLESSLPG